jgi:iron-regulated transporter 1
MSTTPSSPSSSSPLSPHSGYPAPPARNTTRRASTSTTGTSSHSQSLLWRLYVSHTLSTWNARTFEFGAVIFLAAIFPGTLFFASCYALFRAAAAAVLGSWVGDQVDCKNRLVLVRQSIVWQRLSVAGSCLILLLMLMAGGPEKEKGVVMYALFAGSVILACVEKLAFIANTISVERDWIIVVSESLNVDRQELNSTMRRIDLVCKLVAPVGIGLIEGSYSTKLALCIVFAQNAISVVVEYFAIASVYAAVPDLARGKKAPPPNHGSDSETPDTAMRQSLHEDDGNNNNHPVSDVHGNTPPLFKNMVASHLRPWKNYMQNPAFLASFSLSLLYLTVLSFASQMTTYLLSLGFTSTHVSLMRLGSVMLELCATVAAPWLMYRISAVRAGLWFINEQVVSIALAIGLFLWIDNKPMLAGGVLVLGVAFSRLGLWGFDLSVQYLVQEDAPEATRGSFSAIEMSLQNLFELVSFATTMIFYRSQQFKIPVFISAGAIVSSAACFAGFVRRKRGHLLHTDRCLKRMGRVSKAGRYEVLPTIEEEFEMEDDRTRDE